MMLKSKLAAFAGALLLAGAAFAGQQEACPDIKDIQAEGLTIAEEIGPNMFISYNISVYNTPSIWGFVIGPVGGDSDEDALEAGNEILSEMSAPGVPEQHANAMICTYDTGRQDVFAAAIKDEAQVSPLKLKQFIKSVR
jgi:hypothetical protein